MVEALIMEEPYLQCTENKCWTFIMMDLATVKSHGKFVRAPVLYRK